MYVFNKPILKSFNEELTVCKKIYPLLVNQINRKFLIEKINNFGIVSNKIISFEKGVKICINTLVLPQQITPIMSWVSKNKSNTNLCRYSELYYNEESRRFKKNVYIENPYKMKQQTKEIIPKLTCYMDYEEGIREVCKIWFHTGLVSYLDKIELPF